jgi:hypothetical protein
VTAAQVEFRAVRGEHVLNISPQSHGTPVVGSGTFELRTDGIRITGREARTTLPIVVAIVVGVLGVIAAAIVLVSLDIEPDGKGFKKVAFMAGLIAGVLPATGVYRLLRARMHGRAIDAIVPWSAVRVLARTPGTAILRLSSYDLRGDVEVIASDRGSAQIIDGAWPS